MDDNDIPILKKLHELYKIFLELRKLVPKADRHTIYERSEQTLLDTIELLFHAGYAKSNTKGIILEKASVKLNLLRFLVRTMKETKILDMKKYIRLQELIDEIGRVLGGWIRSTR